MGDFLDIMCPHTGLTGTVKPNDTAVFDIYRVTKENFKQCRVEGKSNRRQIEKLLDVYWI